MIKSNNSRPNVFFILRLFVILNTLYLFSWPTVKFALEQVWWKLEKRHTTLILFNKVKKNTGFLRSAWLIGATFRLNSSSSPNMTFKSCTVFRQISRMYFITAPSNTGFLLDNLLRISSAISFPKSLKYEWLTFNFMWYHDNIMIKYRVRQLGYC